MELRKDRTPATRRAVREALALDSRCAGFLARHPPPIQGAERAFPFLKFGTFALRDGRPDQDRTEIAWREFLP